MCVAGAAYNSIAFTPPRGSPAPPPPADYAQRALQQAQKRIQPGAGPYAAQLGAAVKVATDRPPAFSGPRSAKHLLGQ
jgi:hypothetical protein